MQKIINQIKTVLSSDERIVFVYLYGSAVIGEEANDIDIAVFSTENEDPYLLSAELKIDSLVKSPKLNALVTPVKTEIY